MSRATAAGLVLCGLLVVVGVAGVALGSTALPLSDVLAVFGARLGLNAPPDALTDAIVWSLRLPRVLLALCVGGGLAVVGVAMQALVRNPLAEPYVLGLSSGASAGIALFYLGWLPPFLSQALTLPLAAFAGGLGTIVLVFLVARTGTTLSVSRLLLAGVAMASLMGAVSSFATLASPDPNKLRTVLFLVLGSLSGSRWELVSLPAITVLLALGLLLALARPLDALLLGEEPAQHLGLPVEQLKRGLLLLAAFVTGVLVAVSGAIGFVGLMVPHAVRLTVGTVHRRLLPLSFLTGAVFLTAADLAARLVLPGQELPLGILTAICGVPFFLFLLRRHAYRFS